MSTAISEVAVAIGLPTPEIKIPSVVNDFTNRVDSVFRGLGRPLLYNYLSVMANKSVFMLGLRGTGKTRVIRETPHLALQLRKNWDSFTYDELDSFCFNNILNSGTCLTERKILFKIEELSDLAEYHRGLLLTVISKIISDNSYEHRTKWTPNLSFQNCHLTCLIALQPKVYSVLCNKNAQWESMSYDRFTKFLMLNPLRNSTVDDNNSFTDDNGDSILPLPSNPSIEDVTLPANVDTSEVNRLFEGQLSSGRAPLYTRDYLKAYAKFRGNNAVTQQNVQEFHYLFRPYLQSFNILQHATYDYSLEVSAGDLKVLLSIVDTAKLSKISKRELTASLMCSDKMVETNAAHLIEKGLISSSASAAQGAPVSFELSTNLREYFIEYDHLIRSSQ